MENTETVVKTVDPLKHRLPKLLLGTAAGFLATAAAEALYDYVLERKKQTPEIDPK